MDLWIGDQTLRDVDVPLLWGSRAVIQHRNGKLSVVDLGTRPARLEILNDQPAPGVNFVPTIGGFRILSYPEGSYDFSPKEKTLTSWSGDLPLCQIEDRQIRVGTSVLGRGEPFGVGVGPRVTADQIAFQLGLPGELAELMMGARNEQLLPDGSLLVVVSRQGKNWTREKAAELDQAVLSNVARFGAPHLFVWIARDLWESQAPYIRFNQYLAAPGVSWTTGPHGTTAESSYVLYRADPTKVPAYEDEFAAASVA
jgi:hypothetical protein